VPADHVVAVDGITIQNRQRVTWTLTTVWRAAGDIYPKDRQTCPASFPIAKIGEIFRNASASFSTEKIMALFG
jgi:hypothetical protein